MSRYPLSRKLKVVFFYNVMATTLWGCCLGRLLILLPLVGRRFLPGGIADFFHVVSTLPLVGFFVVNLFGRSVYSASDLWSFVNAARMVWICYGVIYPHPRIARHTSYSFLILSWCIQNIVSSSYYSFKVKTRTSPAFLFWLHHHIFFLTFPMAFISELILVFLSLKFVSIKWHRIAIELYVLSYVPLGYLTFQHLLSRKHSKYDEYMEKRRAGRRPGVELQPIPSSSPLVNVTSADSDVTSRVNSNAPSTVHSNIPSIAHSNVPSASHSTVPSNATSRTGSTAALVDSPSSIQKPVAGSENLD